MKKWFIIHCQNPLCGHIYRTSYLSDEDRLFKLDRAVCPCCRVPRMPELMKLAERKRVSETTLYMREYRKRKLQGGLGLV